MSDFTKLYTKIAAIQSTLSTNLVPGDFKAVLIEFESRLLQHTSWPLCALILDNGSIRANTAANITLHAIGLYHEHKAQNLIQKVLNGLEKTYAYMRQNYPELAANENVQLYINQNVLDPFVGIELPLMPPLGGFRLAFPNFRSDLQTNTT